MSYARGRDEGRVVRSVHPRVVYVFDFDMTLAPRTTDELLRHLGVDPEEFSRRWVEPRTAGGWEERLAEAQALVELSQSERGPITAETFLQVAEKLELYPGVPTMFDRLIEAVREVDPALEVEFHLLTAGFIEIPSATAVAERFNSIVGGAWSFGDDDAIAWPKRTVGHYDKVRHLLALAKGLGSVAADRPDDIDRDIPEGEWHVPFEQMIYVGDGDSDLPAFDFMESHAATAVGVHRAGSAEEWSARDNMRDGREVATVLEADYEPGSRLATALETAGRRAALWTSLLRTYPHRT